MQKLQKRHDGIGADVRTDDIVTDAQPGGACAVQFEELPEQPRRLGQKELVGLDLDAVAEVDGDVAKVRALTEVAETGDDLAHVLVRLHCHKKLGHLLALMSSLVTSEQDLVPKVRCPFSAKFK